MKHGHQIITVDHHGRSSRLKVSGSQGGKDSVNLKQKTWPQERRTKWFGGVGMGSSLGFQTGEFDAVQMMGIFSTFHTLMLVCCYIWRDVVRLCHVPETILHATSDSYTPVARPAVLLGLLFFTFSCLTQKYLYLWFCWRGWFLDVQISSRKYLPLSNPTPDFERVPREDLTTTIPTNETCSYSTAAGLGPHLPWIKSPHLQPTKGWFTVI